MRKTKIEPQKLDAVTAARVMAKDLQNILDRVKRGEPLTAQQRRIVEEAAQADVPEKPEATRPEFATSLAQLARSLNTTRQAIGHHRKNPAAPQRRDDGRWSVTEWRSFLAANGRKDLPPGDDDGLDAGTERAGLLRAQRLKVEMANRQKAGELVEAAALIAEAVPSLHAIKAALYQRVVNELPMALAGVDVAQGRVIAGRIADQLLRDWQAVFQKWTH